MPIRLCLAALFAAVCLITATGTSPAQDNGDGTAIRPESFTLDNGLQTVVVTMRRAPVVLHMVWYRVGAADEPPGHSGLAHFLEHLMFKATDNLEDGEFSRIVARNGGRENAFTSQDFTAYYQFVARDRLPRMMALEADRMVNLVLSERHVSAERNVILEERRQVVESRPRSVLFEQARAALYRNHPYGTPVIGWRHEIASLTRAQVLDFYRRHYAPNNAIVVLVGDIGIAEARRMVADAYGDIPRAEVPDRFRPQEPEHRAERRLTYRDSRVQSPSFTREYAAPSYLSEGSEHAYALEILSDVLGGGNSSRLYRELVVERGLAVSAGSSYSPSRRDQSSFGVRARLADGVDMEQLEAAIDAILADIIENGITEQEMENARARVTASAIYARDEHLHMAYWFGQALAIGQDLDEAAAWPERIRAVTRDEVLAAAQRVLRPHRSVTALLLPEEGEGR